MTEVVYILKILLYFLLLYGVYHTAKYRYAIHKPLSWRSILVYVLFFGIYAIIIGNPETKQDRYIYAIRYVDPYWDVSETESPGLNFAYNILRPISLNPNFLYFVFYVVYMGLTLIAYRFYKSAKPQALLFLLCSLYPIFGFYALKQCIANVFVLLAFVVYFNLHERRKGLGKTIYAWSFIIVLLAGAISFHEAAMIVPLVFLLFVFWKYKIVRILGYWGIIVGLVCIAPLFNYIFGSIGSLSENLAQQTANYDAGLGFTGNILTGIKGLPFYIITYIAIKYRRVYHASVGNYDKYLLLSILVSCFHVCSIYNYWLFRFALFFYFPVMVFAQNFCSVLVRSHRSRRWLSFAFWTCLALSVKEIAQLYFLYGGV